MSVWNRLCKGTVYFMNWSHGFEYWIGVMEWSIGVASWSGLGTKFWSGTENLIRGYSLTLCKRTHYKMYDNCINLRFFHHQDCVFCFTPKYPLQFSTPWLHSKTPIHINTHCPYVSCCYSKVTRDLFEFTDQNAYTSSLEK